uniref:LAGLIDADG endonuclease n=1 Tax=Ophiocordycipitaceae sp. TaxID=1907519 RepID=A0A7S8HPJ1_9HYPO|nr:LAGLIDADG endonuclease [Ophiocordycipitaceae sp.]QUT09493.1 LAGLIDADG endonuclease [Ophiocordycipitaceae sp.]QUT09521.1 LAGLIDADG endonuclease [Ophiocordycipitaceae sp.]QUT13251.1 LAGLIDADG endonuclease [Ophiocordycipitaceae sp.]DAJ12192.1 TPA_asm: LAGLIDADG endonuclease [Ophiocordycipitaceae sp.]
MLGLLLFIVLNTSSIVTKLKQWSKSAESLGQSIKVQFVLTETLHSETVVRDNQVKEKIMPISVHVPKHLKPLNDDEFGHYLAGLIDGDGHFSSNQELIIKFHLLDASLAYYVKQRIGFGSVKKVKDKNVLVLIIRAKKGVEKVINLINGKIRRENNLVPLNLNQDLQNHWLAGFSDAVASFHIKVRECSMAPEAVLSYKIHKKLNMDLLLLIKDYLGGFYKENTYCTMSYGSAKKVINYLDNFHLLSGSKHINYLKWRKAYLIVQNKDHLNQEGVNKILKLKRTSLQRW